MIATWMGSAMATCVYGLLCAVIVWAMVKLLKPDPPDASYCDGCKRFSREWYCPHCDAYGHGRRPR